MLSVSEPTSEPTAREPRWDSSAADIVSHVPSVRTDTPCHKVFRLLEQFPHWAALAVIDPMGRIAGLVARSQCLSILSKPLMLDLYSKRPVERIMHSTPLVVDVGESIDSILERIADNDSEALVNGFIITENDNYLGVATAQDLLVKSVEQARRRSEALELARRQAEEASSAKSSFLANLSHEIRTPLNGVLANLELLGMTPVDDEQAELIGSASVAAQALFEIIGDVLDLSKIESGKLSVELIDMDLSRLFEELATLVGTQANARDIAFEHHLSLAAAMEVRGDPTRLRQILMNLCGNAMKFTKAGGVYLSVFLAGRDEERCEIWMEVADTGIGFDPERKDKLFEAFVQEDATTTRRFGGTGLGLSICRCLTDLMGGTIDAESEPSGGATFWCRLSFPVVAAPIQALVDISGLSLLVVDANRGRAERLSGTLTMGGAAVKVSSETDHALGLLLGASSSGNPFDAVLIAPGEDGSGLELLTNGLAGLVTVPILLTEVESVRLRRQGFLCGLRHWSVFSAGLHDLFLTVATATGRIRRESSRRDGIDIVSLKESLRSCGTDKVLVIDDTPMNRQVAKRQLAKLGFECDLADSGRHGIQLATSEHYALILSDIQMPEMDGHAFTRQYREWEERNGRTRTPVIAMTANAMGGAGRQCLEAGMDDYMTKPVKIERLAEIMAKWLVPHLSGLRLEDRSTKTAEGPCPIDQSALAEQLGDDSPETLREIVEMFVEFYPPLESDLAEAVAAEDRPQTRSRAHTAKGAARNAAATGLGDALHEIEMRAMQADWSEIVALTEWARKEFFRISSFAAELAIPSRTERRA